MDSSKRGMLRGLQTGQAIRHSPPAQGSTAARSASPPRLRSEKRTPIELQLFPGQNLCLRDAIALDLVLSPSLETLLQNLDGHIRSGILPPLTVLAMVLSALHDNFSRGRVHLPVVWENLLSHTVKNMPDDCRLEALLVFRCLQGGKADAATVQACEQAFAKRYINLPSKAKAARLEKWVALEWWHPAICNFAGHAGPGRMKRMAVQGLLAMLGSRLQGKPVDSQTRCLMLLLQHLYPEQTETPPAGPLDLAPWQPCLEAWATLASRLGPKDLANLMLELLMPMLNETPGLWPHQAEILLDALAQSLALLNQQARQEAIDNLPYLFAMLSPKAFAIHHSNPRLAVSLAMKMLKMLQQTNDDWAKNLGCDLRQVINADPENSPFKPNLDPTNWLDDCKTQ